MPEKLTFRRLNQPKPSLEAGTDLYWWNYHSPYKHIAERMKEQNIRYIGGKNGTSEKVDRFFLENGEEENYGIDMDRRTRASRNIWISKISVNELEMIQHYEKRILGRFLFSFEAVHRFKLNIEPNETVTSDQYEVLFKVSEETRPEPKKFFGESIPPYFPLDITFSGMDYHHEWDRNVQSRHFVMPMAKSGKAVKLAALQ